MIKIIKFQNINFNNFENQKFNEIIKKKGYYTFPSAPGIASINSSKEYYHSLKKAHYVFFDSGFFVLLLRIFKNIKVSKFSGYKFLFLFFRFLKLNKNKSVFCIDPNNIYSKSNKHFLKKLGLKKIYSYIAPKYNSKNLTDNKLIKQINKTKPDFVLTNIGGGTQEILAFRLNKKLKRKTIILCTGGAISFFTGDQAPINRIIDKFYLGWLVRMIFNPFIFTKRYFYALKLIPMVLLNKIKIQNE
tara:strand:- start:100 stop:834 length:735 start_codon:yes stop_codon:yes gene_type:complete